MLDWQLSELDWTTHRVTEEIFVEAFEQMGAGHRAGTNAHDDRPVEVLHSNHQLGTTRMAVRRDDGVVDANCKAHDLDNLYIIGGSVFPSGSWANPTFTVMAMTYRLADHLRGLLRK